MYVRVSVFLMRYIVSFFFFFFTRFVLALRFFISFHFVSFRFVSFRFRFIFIISFFFFEYLINTLRQ